MRAIQQSAGRAAAGALLVISGCVAATALGAQGVLYGYVRDPGVVAATGSTTVATAGDTNLDGVADFMIELDGALHLISGRDGALLRSFPGGGLQPASGPVGDLNGDGAAEVVVIDDSRVDVYSGASAQLLYSITPGGEQNVFPVSVAGIGDVDGDSVPDMISMTDAGLFSQVEFNLISGRTGATAFSWVHQAAWLAERTVRSLGDVDGDGARDFAAQFVGVSSWSARTEVWSARARMLQFASPAYQARDAGDVDGDGRDDVLLNYYSRAYNSHQTELEGSPGTLHIWPWGHAGGASAGDVDGDGTPDIVIATQGAIGTLDFYSGRTFGLIASEPHSLRSPGLDQLSDLDADGRRELVLRGYTYPPGGVRYWIRVRTSTVLDLEADIAGAKLGGSLDTQALSLQAPTGFAGQSYWMLGSLSGTSPGIPLGPVVLPLRFDSYTLLTAAAPAQGLLAAPIGVLSATGAATVRFAVPSVPALAGLTFHHSYVLFGAGFVPTYASRPAPMAIFP